MRQNMTKSHFQRTNDAHFWENIGTDKKEGTLLFTRYHQPDLVESQESDKTVPSERFG